VSICSKTQTFQLDVDADSQITNVISATTPGKAAGMGTWEATMLGKGQTVGATFSPMSVLDVVGALRGFDSLLTNIVPTTVTLTPIVIGNPGLKGLSYYDCQAVNVNMSDEALNSFSCTLMAGSGMTTVSKNGNQFYASATFSTCPVIVFSDEDPAANTLQYIGATSQFKTLYKAILALPNPVKGIAVRAGGFGWRFLNLPANK